MNIQHMSLREKIGQVFTFSAFAPQMDEAIASLIREYKIGGVFLGTGCLLNTEEIYKLTSDLQQLSIQEGSGDTLLISADFVAGVGSKVKSGVTHFPKNWAMGAAGDDQLAYEAGRITAKEALALGVNMNYSPVVDINNNPLNPVIGTHSFGEERDEVVRLANAVIRGYQDHGLIATAKHFPGHGDTSVDSHYDLPELPFTQERLRDFELVPFQKAIEVGVDAVMVGHMAVPSLDPTLTPASLSYPITTGILRNELGFEGLIVTDGLSMKGITHKYGMAEAGVMALQAGADILLATTDGYELSVAMIEAVYKAVENGVITEARIDESVERILRAKQKYKISADSLRDTFDASLIGTDEGQEIALSIARKAVTPSEGLERGVLQQLDPAAPLHLIYDERCSVFAEGVKSAGLHSLTVETFASLDEADQLLSEIDSSSAVILVTAGNKPIGAEASKRIEDRLQAMNTLVWAHFGSEYDAADTSVPCLLMYDYAAPLQTAAFEYLLGQGKA